MENILLPDQTYIDGLMQRKTPLPMEFIMSGMRNSDLMPCVCPEIAIVGRSNVGKSSLINYLAGQNNLARVSRTPGRTQTINLFSVEKNKFIFVDLPGYGFAQSAKDTRQHWEKSMAEFFLDRDGLFAVLFLLDVRREITAEDKELCKWLQKVELRILGVQTKCDKVNKRELNAIKLQQARDLGIPPGMLISTSVLKKTGLESVCIGIGGMLEELLK